MLDRMNELTQHAPHAGTLFLQKVSGDISGRREAENDVNAAKGSERTMYGYVPVSGCPHPKQCQVVMVLRNEATEESAYNVMKMYGLDDLAEDKNFLLLFPNPTEDGWNVTDDPARESDIDFLIRCFGILKGSELGVSGFNGMIFYIAASPQASELLMTMAAKRPLNVPAMMIGGFTPGYEIPADALGIETAAWVSCNDRAANYFKWSNGIQTDPVPVTEHTVKYYGKNPNVRLLVSSDHIDTALIRLAWEELFSETRRWQNDTYGCYQERTNFTEKGFVGHVKDSSLGVNGGFPHTWYEYIPPQLRGTDEKVPLLFYFHGGGCVPLYGAEQSDWHRVADKENFIVVYPEASAKNTWNVWNDKELPYSDKDFFLALIDHMDEVHPIDRTRIYVSGFSMGGMMSNAMACSLPNVIAAAAPCNAYQEGYFASYGALVGNMGKGGGAYDPGETVLGYKGEPSDTRKTADARKELYDYRMPVIQTSGLIDGRWPIPGDRDSRVLCFNYWKRYNNIPVTPVTESPYESGLTADVNEYLGDDERFLHHAWKSEDEGHPFLYELFLAKRMPHALDIRTTGYLWKFLKKFRRAEDGRLIIEED